MTDAAPPKAPVVTLPPGRHGMSRDAVVDSQRERLLDAMVGAAAEVGYVRVTVDDVVRRARTAKRTFYAMFPDREACFLAAYDRAVSRVLAAVAAALDFEAHPFERIERGVSALLGALAADPDAARVGLIEIMGVGPEGMVHRVAFHQNFADALVAWHEESRRRWPELQPLSPVAALAVIGAINEPIAMALSHDGAAGLHEMADELTRIVISLMFNEPPRARDAPTT